MDPPTKQIFTKVAKLCDKDKDNEYFFYKNGHVILGKSVYEKKNTVWELSNDESEIVFRMIPLINDLYEELEKYKEENEGMFSYFILIFKHLKFNIYCNVIILRVERND